MKDLPSRSLRLLREKKKTAAGIAGGILAVISIAAGTAIVPSDFEVPVMLANGEIITPPWYVTVDGERVALVDSEDDAREVVKKTADHYKNKETVKIEIEEQTSTQAMKLENGDEKPEILTVEEAAEKIMSKDELTVKTTDVVTEQKAVKFKELTEKTDDLYEGQIKVKQEGKKGLKEVTKKITKENGKVVKEDVIGETVLREAEPEITLTGTKENPSVYQISRGGTHQGTGQLAKPLDSLRITSEFGPRWGSTHLGVDFGMTLGSSIYAADGGTVTFAGWCGSYGNLIKVDHGNGLMTYYAHCSQLLVSQGQTVQKGETIAKVGSTGHSTGPHLHFEVRVNGQNVNPLDYL